MRAKHHLSLAIGAACAALAFAALLPARAQAQDVKSIRIGYALPKTGPLVAGATQSLNAYRMWVREVNDAGGIMLKSVGKKVPIEVIEYDSHSSVDETVTLIERLATQDKVDLILAPWGTNFNAAVAPVFDRLGYPLLAVAAITDEAPEFAKKWPNTFWLQDTSKSFAESLVEMLAKLKADGKINDTVAVVNVADQLGVELARDAKPALAKAGFKLVYEKSYPDGADPAPIIKEAAAAKPDAFIAFSYPPDTFGFTGQAIAQKFNPKVFYTCVGAALPVYHQKFRANVEGVMGMGAWTPDLPAVQEWRKRYIAIMGGEPDRSSSIQYDMLQMLQQAIERVGKIDRAAIANEIRTGTFDTIDGKVKAVNNIVAPPWYVNQWQNGEFYGLAPIGKAGARAPIVPKPEWKSTTASAQ